LGCWKGIGEMIGIIILSIIAIITFVIIIIGSYYIDKEFNKQFKKK